MFWDGLITPRQKQGVIISLPKKRGTIEPGDLHPSTLLNTNYKILMRIVAQRLRPVLARHLKDTQLCGVPGKSILDATATIRYIIAFAETEKFPLCVLSIDFKNAFDNIVHEYLFQTLKRYGICDPLIHGIMNMYECASSFVQINGHSYGPIPNKCGVLQGCPMSMVLYALCLQPFLIFLNRKMAGIKIGNEMSPTAVFAYADDVTIFVRHEAGLAIVEEAINLFEKARLNPPKSKVIATGGWNTTATIRGIVYYQSATIVGVTWGTTRQTMDDTWARKTGKVRIQAKKTHDRDACLAHRMRYVNTHLLSKLWYIAQILPAPGRTHSGQRRQ
jgi:hypothetical protein